MPDGIRLMKHVSFTEISRATPERRTFIINVKECSLLTASSEFFLTNQERAEMHHSIARFPYLEASAALQGLNALTNAA
jgi:hypothetical protein